MLEAYLFMLFCVPLPVVNLGNAAGLIFSSALIFCTANYETLSGTAVFIAAEVILATAILAAAVLTVKMLHCARNTPPERGKCTVIILGCRVRGTRPSRMLRRRLRAAYTYLKKNPEAVCIVSGGQGADEEISEAAAMREYLLSLGLVESRIFCEDKSTSTRENLEFSLREIRRLGLSETVTIATDGFHQYRAGVMARALGMRTYAISAVTEPRYAATYWVREWFAIGQVWLRKVARK
jgi:uncharacterized SAM-binding protein YcdF (DUF218 family)